MTYPLYRPHEVRVRGHLVSDAQSVYNDLRSVTVITLTETKVYQGHMSIKPIDDETKVVTFGPVDVVLRRDA